jgi:predicted aspartyl protease
MYYQTKNVSVPIPVLSIHIGPLGQRPVIGPITAIVDTGADMTLLPVSWIQPLQVAPFSAGRLFGQWRDPHVVDFYLIELAIGGIRLTNIQIAANEEVTEVIIGRNVLNKLPLFLDGPQQQIEILDDATIKRLRSRRKLA